jgi:hypothetical protein
MLSNTIGLTPDDLFPRTIGITETEPSLANEPSLLSLHPSHLNDLNSQAIAIEPYPSTTSRLAS